MSGILILFLETLYTTKDFPRGPRTTKAGNYPELAFPEHFHSQPGILKEVESSQFQTYDHPELEHSSTFFDIGQSCLVKRCHLRNGGLYLAPQSYDFHSIHHLCDIDFLRTSGSTCFTRCAQPDRLAVKNKVIQTETDGVYQLGGFVVHGVRYRTAGRTLPALITKVHILAAFTENRFSQL
jgi:hypothetical protein